MTFLGKLGWHRYEKPQKSRKNLNDIGKFKENLFFIIFLVFSHVFLLKPIGREVKNRTSAVSFWGNVENRLQQIATQPYIALSKVLFLGGFCFIFYSKKHRKHENKKKHQKRRQKLFFGGLFQICPTVFEGGRIYMYIL